MNPAVASRVRDGRCLERAWLDIIDSCQVPWPIPSPNCPRGLDGAAPSRRPVRTPRRGMARSSWSGDASGDGKRDESKDWRRGVCTGVPRPSCSCSPRGAFRLTVRQRILSCSDLAIVDRWFDRALHATSLSEVLDDLSQ